MAEREEKVPLKTLQRKKVTFESTRLEETKDYVYAYALSNTLIKVLSPATVGLYSSCQYRLKRILKQIEESMNKEASALEQNANIKPRSVEPSFWGFLALISRLIFFRPVWTEANQCHKSIRFMYVHFSAWHFAGSDLLWAGIAIRLIQAIQSKFGRLQLALYRVVQHEEEEEIKKESGAKDSWEPKKVCCCPLWIFILLNIVAVLGILVIYKFSETSLDQVINPTGDDEEISGTEGLLIALAGLPALGFLRYAIPTAKNMIFTLDRVIKKEMDDQNISRQLGFMNDVRKEVWVICRFIRFMEVFERRRIRVVLKITHLDRCSPKKIVAVLDAINILLSDEESPFISILAVNPDVLLEKVNLADGSLRADRSHALLNHIITLPFTVPPLDEEMKVDLLNRLTIKSDQNGRSLWDLSSVEVEPDGQPSNNINKPTQDERTGDIENLRRDSLKDFKGELTKFMSEDAISMRRVINSIRITATIMVYLEKKLPQTKTLAAWVVLANQWPCRFSWIIQCVEDDKQRADIDGKQTEETDSKTLWEVFDESRAELYLMRSQITDLLNEDGDPELFEKLLKVKRFKFNIANLEAFLEVTVNVDQSIKNQLAHIRATSRLKDSGLRSDFAPLSIKALLKMDTNAVCEEMKKKNYEEKYLTKVRENRITGFALVSGNDGDIKNLLDMPYGDWMTFKVHFMSVSADFQAQCKNNQ